MPIVPWRPQVTDVQAMLASVEGSLADFNAQSKTHLGLVIFQYAAEHISRISRIIKQPYGNALLVRKRPGKAAALAWLPQSQL